LLTYTCFDIGSDKEGNFNVKYQTYKSSEWDKAFPKWKIPEMPTTNAKVKQFIFRKYNKEIATKFSLLVCQPSASCKLLNFPDDTQLIHIKDELKRLVA